MCQLWCETDHDYHWFGRILAIFDEQDLWKDTALIVCTDHGHYLGEQREGKDIWETWSSPV